MGSQSNSSMATTRTENAHGLTYPVTRAIDITAWQSVNTVCLCCLTHGVCASYWTMPDSTLFSQQRDGECYHLSMPSPLPQCSVCAACLYIIARRHSLFLCVHVYFFFVITHRSVLSTLISNLINKYSSPKHALHAPSLVIYVDEWASLAYK